MACLLSGELQRQGKAAILPFIRETTTFWKLPGYPTAEPNHPPACGPTVRDLPTGPPGSALPPKVQLPGPALNRGYRNHERVDVLLAEGIAAGLFPPSGTDQVPNDRPGRQSPGRVSGGSDSAGHSLRSVALCCIPCTWLARDGGDGAPLRRDGAEFACTAPSSYSIGGAPCLPKTPR